jgi:hypothetical protein
VVERDAITGMQRLEGGKQLQFPDPMKDPKENASEL